ncbi:DNA-binding transcriptional ArsR family regulator [Kutzneria buriramensis]|uniref:DNA-binding transcriptional ArsR family regulator n=1 Tax=Kutzneria buriramensis TaxID=1045776 RepID=A0A3E0GXA5_9PSEU|nr:DNA-binding transcriptional ArsR family regulator [Kutzneria buriramensis]
MTELRLESVLAALADPVRLALVRVLAGQGESACYHAAHQAGLTISRSTVSHHLRILRNAGVISQRVEGTARIVRLREDDLAACFPGLLEAVLNAPAPRD